MKQNKFAKYLFMIRKSVLSLVIPVMAAFLLFGVSETVMADTAEITFTNEPVEEPDLYITKTVVNAISGYTAPEDTEFTFVLKWDPDGDGKLTFAKNEEYTVYASDGTEVKNYDEATGLEIPFTTSSTGRFTLKAGQTAKFSYVGEDVAYTVTEEAIDDFTQTLPAGGEAASGTVAADGTMVSFENTYIPTVPTPDDGDDPTTMLSVRKDISWPDGYEVPDFGNIFTFELKISGEAYAEQEYTVYDTATDEAVATGTTDEEGKFAISGGQRAVFTDVLLYADYEIQEILSDGWQAVGSTSAEGGTTYPATYEIFTNRTASFIVTKSFADGGTSDENFTFYVMDTNGTGMSGWNYYLYDSDGNLADEAVHTTGTDGSFTLQAGQSAIFVGIDEGTVYCVTEDADEASEKHFLVSPEDGYQSCTVQSTPETLEFVNTAFKKVNISVTKVSASNSTLVFAGAVFGFYADESCSDSSLITALTTGKDGTVTLPGQYEGTWYIKEITAPEGYQLNQGIFRVTISYSTGTGSDVPTVTVERLTDEETGEALAEGSEARKVSATVEAEASDGGESYTVFFDIADECLYELPGMGFFGIERNTLLAVLIMAIAWCGFLCAAIRGTKSKKKNSARKAGEKG